VKSGLATFGVLVSVAFLGVLWNIILGRTLEPQGVGILAVIISCSTLFFTVGHLTFGVSTVYRMGQVRDSTERFAANSLLVGLSAGGLLYLLFVCSIHLAGSVLYGSTNLGLLHLAFIAATLYLITYQLSSVLQGLGRIGEYNTVNLTRHGSSVVLLLLFVVLLRLGITGAVIAFICGFALAAVFAVYFVLKQTGAVWRIDLGLLRSTLAISGKMHIASVATLIYSQVGILVANYYLVASEVGYLYIALVYVQFLFFIPQAAQVVLYPRVAGSSDRDATTVCIATCRHLLLWSVVGALFLGLAGRVVIGILVGGAFYPSLPLIRIMLPGVMLSSVSQVMVALWIKKRRYWLMAASGVVVCAVGLVLQISLVSRYGVGGAAVASCLTYVVGFLLTMGIAVRYLGRDVWHMLVFGRDDVKVYRDILCYVGRLVHR